MGAERWDEQVGSVADEAARLLESLRRSAETAEPAHPGGSADSVGSSGSGGPSRSSEPTTSPGSTDGPAAGDPTDAAAPAPGVHDPFCTWCPLCRTAEVVRTLSPETITRLADLASLAATVLADLASSRAAAAGADGPRGAPDDGEPDGRQDPGTSRPRRATSSRPIPVRDADDPQEAPRG